jgi:hypothetical protein
MKRMRLDSAAPAVKRFVQALAIAPEGVELELAGQVIARLFPPGRPPLSDAEKAVVIARGRELVRRARERNKGVPAAVVAREVRRAVNAVRRRRHG